MPRALLALGLMLLIGVSCKNIDKFEGRWEGDVAQSRLVRRGVDFCTRLVLNIDHLESASMDARLTFERPADATVCSADVTNPPEDPVVALPTPELTLELDKLFLNDDMAGMTFSGEPLFTHLAHATLPAPWGDEPVMVFLAFHPGPSIKVRIISKNIFAVFSLKKKGGEN